MGFNREFEPARLEKLNKIHFLCCHIKTREKKFSIKGRGGCELNHTQRSEAGSPAEPLQEHQNSNTPSVMNSVNQSRKFHFKLMFLEYFPHLF